MDPAAAHGGQPAGFGTDKEGAGVKVTIESVETVPDVYVAEAEDGIDVAEELVERALRARQELREANVALVRHVLERYPDYLEPILLSHYL